MSDKANLMKDAAGGWRATRERSNGGRKGSYDAKGNFIEGSEPAMKPRAPKSGSYDKRGKLIKAMTGQK
jgi:hypothetical protein